MTRRRLILAIVAAVLFGMAWWLSLDRLSAEERLLVGTWLFGGKSGTGRIEHQFLPDRQCWFGFGQPSHITSYVFSGRWFIRRGELVFDSEPSAVRRVFRPVLSGLGYPTARVDSYGLESITARELVLVMSDGTRETWTRAPGEVTQRGAAIGLSASTTWFTLDTGVVIRADGRLSTAHRPYGPS
jgi:hypothetical protein